MKNALIIVLSILSITLVDAQKIKISDGCVLLDKVPIAKIEGKSGLFKKTDLLFSSLDGQPLIRVNEKRYDYFLETYNDLFWYDITLIKSNDKIAWAANAMYSQKQLAEWLFVKTEPRLLRNNEIDTVAWNAFKSNIDVGKKIQADTTAYLEFESMLINQLKNARCQGRNVSKPVSFVTISSTTFADSTVSSFKIVQDGYLIGFLDKTVEKNSMGVSGYYYVYRAFDPAFDYNGKTYEKGLAAFMNISFTTPMLQLTQIKKRVRADFALGENAEGAIVKYMIDNGYL